MAYGAGLGVESLETLNNIVEVVAETHWKEDDGVNRMENILAAIDQDISQAVESAKQQIEAGHIDDIERAGQVKEALFKALQKCEQSVGAWNAEMFPFPRGLESVRGWRDPRKWDADRVDAKPKREAHRSGTAWWDCWHCELRGPR